MSVDRELAEIRVTSGVSLFTKEGFITVHAVSKEGDSLHGQLSPAECREQGLAFLEAAEAAESDAAIWAAVRAAGSSDEVAGHILTAIREARQGNN